MKTLLMLSAASLLLAPVAARADVNGIDQAYLARVAAQADARLSAAHIRLEGPLKVQASFSGDRLNGVRFDSTGDLATDKAVDQALRRMPVDQVPAALSGRTVTLTFRSAPVTQAQIPHAEAR